MDSSRVLYADDHAISLFYYNRQEFWDIIGQNDEKGHFDLFSSLVRYETAIFEIKIFCSRNRQERPLWFSNYHLFVAQLELEL